MKAWVVILSFQCFFTFILTGLIWCVQVVKYPLFHLVDRDKFCDFEKKFQRRISFLLFPLIVLECFFAVLMLTVAKEGVEKILSFTLFGLLLFVWFSTFCLQIPEHVELSNGFSLKNIRRLIQTNWIRTIAWSLRSFILLWLLCKL
jgi:hypothetical protein